MREYLVMLIVISAISGFASYASYPSAMERCSKFAISIIVLHVALMPLLSITDEIMDFDFDSFKSEISLPENESGEYLEYAEDAFKLGIKKLLYEKYGLDESEVHVVCFGFDFEKMTAEKIKITLSGKAALADYRAIEEYMEKNKLGDCEVNISLGK